MRGMCLGCLLTLAVNFSGCGGGKDSATSGASFSSKSPQSSISSSQVSSRNSQVDYVQQLIVDEDSSIEFLGHEATEVGSVYLIDISDPTVVGVIPRKLTTAKGANIEMSADNMRVKYTPKRNFHGEDEFFYWVYDSGKNFHVKVNVVVNSIVDENPEITFKKSGFFSAGDTLVLGFPFDVEQSTDIQPDATTKFYINNVLVEHSVVGTEITLVLPDVERAGLQKLVYEQQREEKIIKVESFILIKIIEGNIEYYQGNGRSPGHMVTIARANNINDVEFDRWLNQIFGAFLNIPLVDTYKQYLNVAVVKPAGAISYELGTDIANYGYYSSHVRFYGASDAQMVILFGENVSAVAGSLVSMSSLHPMKTFVHELGHIHAKLADEYVTDTPRFEYPEGANPNVSNFINRDPNVLPWIHWLPEINNIAGIHRVEKNEIEVGAFLGAYYTRDRFYRPTKNSVMFGGDALGEVNSEAWALASYERMGILSFANESIVNSKREISLQRDWDKNITQVDWFINGEKQAELSNQTKIVVDENTISASSYSVKATITDLTDYIRNPVAYPAFNSAPGLNSTFEREWQFDKAINASGRQKTVNAKQRINVNDGNTWRSYVVSVGNGVHQLGEPNNYIALDSMLPVTAASDLAVDVVVDNQVVYRQGVTLKHYHAQSVVTPLLQNINRFYRIAHPQLNGNYLLRVYELPQKNIVAEFSF